MSEVIGILDLPTISDNKFRVLMQYAGIKDQNGVEIYEGDILRITDGADEIERLDSNTGIGVVEWLEDYLLWYVTNVNNGLGDLNDVYYFEVIGNIHENPELSK